MAVRATEEVRRTMVAAQECAVAVQQGQRRHLADLKEQVAADKLADVQNTEQRTEVCTSISGFLRIQGIYRYVHFATPGIKLLLSCLLSLCVQNCFACPLRANRVF